MDDALQKLQMLEASVGRAIALHKLGLSGGHRNRPPLECHRSAYRELDSARELLIEATTALRQQLLPTQN